MCRALAIAPEMEYARRALVFASRGSPLTIAPFPRVQEKPMECLAQGMAFAIVACALVTTVGKPKTVESVRVGTSPSTNVWSDR